MCVCVCMFFFFSVWVLWSLHLYWETLRKYAHFNRRSAKPWKNVQSKCCILPRINKNFGVFFVFVFFLTVVLNRGTLYLCICYNFDKLFKCTENAPDGGTHTVKSLVVFFILFKNHISLLFLVSMRQIRSQLTMDITFDID